MNEDFNIASAIAETISSGEVPGLSGENGGESASPAEAPAPDTAGAEAPSPTPAPSPSPEPSPAPAPVEDIPYPKSWKPGQEAKWAALDLDIRREVARREEDFHKGLSSLREGAEFAQRMRKAVEPYAAWFRESGVDPAALFANFTGAHLTLSKGGAEGADFLRRLASTYKIDLSAEPAYVDPQTRALQEQIEGVSSRLSQREQADLAAKREAARVELETFSADPKNDLFPQVGHEMAILLHANAKMTLGEAYEKAVWLNPTTRAVMLERQEKAAQAAKAEEERKRAEAAVAASKGSVRNTARAAPETSEVGSIQDTMRETFRAIQARTT